MQSEPACGLSLAEYVMAKKALVDLCRSSLEYTDPMLASVEQLDVLKTMLQRAMLELSKELERWAPQLRLDFVDQQREITAAISADRPTERSKRFASTKEDLLSKLLGVAASASTRLDEDVSDKAFVSARGTVRQLKTLLREVYMAECIPY